MRRLLSWISCLFLLFSTVSLATAGTWTTHEFIYKPAIGARGEREKANHDAGMDRVDARLAKEIWVGDPNYGSTLQNAVAAIGPTQTILRVPKGTHPIAAGLAIPANIALKPERGAILNITIPDVDIEGLSKAWPCVVTWTGHGLSTGDKVTFSGITQDGWNGFNGCSFSITKINDNSFSIPMATYDNYVFPATYVPGTDPGKISKVLDIRGGFEAGEYQVFSANPGKVVIGKGRVDKILPQWWGAVADGATDCAAAMQAAFYAMETGYGGRVHFSNGVYYVASSVIPTNFNYLSSIASPLIIRITGDNATLYTDQPISILKRWPSEATMNAYTYGTPVVDGLRFKGTSHRLQVGLDWGGSFSARITNCRFETLGRGLRLTYAMNPVIENCMADQCVVAGFTFHDGYGLWSNSHSWATNLGKIQNCRNYAAAAAPVNIEGMAAANPCVVTWTNHGLASGDVVFIDGITQANWTALNKRRFQITKIGDNSFSLQKMNRTDAGLDVDASTFGAYVPGTDPGVIQAAAFGFELFNTYSMTLDTPICEGGNLTDNLFFYSPAPATDFYVRNYYSENTPYGSNLYLNYNGGLIKLDTFGSRYGDILIDAYDMSQTALGVVSTSGLLKNNIGDQKIRLPNDYEFGYLRWEFTSGGGYAYGWDMHNPAAWYGGKTPLWGIFNYPLTGSGPEMRGGQVMLQGSYGVFVNQESSNGPNYFAGQNYGGLRSEANASGGGGVGAYDITNSQAIMVRQKAAEITITASGVSTQTISNFIQDPQYRGVMVIGFTARITEAIGGATSFSIGDGSSATLWGASIPVAINSTSALQYATATGPKIYGNWSDVILTANGGNFNGTGKVRLTCHYIVLEPPQN